ncbi:hypothetical protein [Alteriqipengyuania lutimaris]|uniref:Uncharacterized protein n=1 Tax=Alteriqipengyuania lutimaris TaxID=1538146 RepID=A0A395LJ46_9SPHN|nr:hypothetical protein [Alteriqipengyuania lutimaris]MBB3034067.1 hypothetical protein [Alteriqipengyuania lutimaris]RDS76993.1 hypothetical protein DL238_04805 [Alteriqipengyuania lutimaris]
MSLLREIPPKWWAVLVGVAFGSLALIALDGPRKGYGKSVMVGAMTAPLLCLFAGALLPSGTSLELAALIGGMTALGGTALILTVARMVPSIASAALTGIARSYLEITPTPPGEPPKVTRVRQDGTPEEPDSELEELARQLDDPPEGG